MTVVFRVVKTKNYTMMSNQHLKDKRLTLKAKGLMSVMLSLPENWDYTLRGLSAISREGVDAALFQRLKRSAIGRRIRGLDSFDGMCYRMAVSDFDGYDYFRFPELYDAICAEDVREMIEQSVTASRAVLSLILPKQSDKE